MLKRLLFFALAVLFFGLRANGAEGEMEGLPAAAIEAEQEAPQQPLMPLSPDTADDDTQVSPSVPGVVSEDAATQPQQTL